MLPGSWTECWLRPSQLGQSVNAEEFARSFLNAEEYSYIYTYIHYRKNIDLLWTACSLSVCQSIPVEMCQFTRMAMTRPMKRVVFGSRST